MNLAGEVKRSLTRAQQRAIRERETSCRRKGAHLSGDPFAYCFNRCAGY